MNRTDDAPLAALARKLRQVLGDEEWSEFDGLYRSILPRLGNDGNGQPDFSRLTSSEMDLLSGWATVARQREHMSTSVTTASSLMTDLNNRLAAREAIREEAADQYW